MNDVSHHEATMRFLYGYVVRKKYIASRPGRYHSSMGQTKLETL